MSNYDNFISDFPERCGKLLDNLWPRAKSRRLEVTHILTVATSSIIVPYARLIRPPSEDFPHPSRDRDRFLLASQSFDQLLETRFLGSPVWIKSDKHSWKFGRVQEVTGDPDSWPELRKPNSLSDQKKVKAVIKHLRNALAHGNIFTRGRPTIEKLVFLSQVAQRVYKFNYLVVEPDDFRLFLEKWIEYLASIDMPTNVAEEFAEAAA